MGKQFWIHRANFLQFKKKKEKKKEHQLPHHVEIFFLSII